jgi:cytochrome P450
MFSARYSFPPGPGRLTSLAAFGLSPLDSFAAWKRKYGPIIGFTLPSGPACIVYRPEETQKILLKETDKYTLGGLAFVTAPLLGNGLGRLTGSQHLAKRRLLQPMFDHQRLIGYAQQMVEQIEQLVERWPAEQVVDLHTAMGELTLASAAKVLFGSTIDAGAAIRAYLDVADRAKSLLRSPLQMARQSRLGDYQVVRWLAEKQMNGYLEAIQRVNQIIQEIFQARREASDPGNDMLGLLLNTRDQDGTLLSDKHIRDELSTFLFAGHDTTMATLSFCLYVLARNPNVAAEVLREQRAVLGNRQPTFGDVPHLRLTRMVIEEVLRLYPPAWMTVRNPRDEVELGGYRIPANTRVFLSQWLLHRDEAYFPAPERFDPWRWEDPKTAERLEREGKYAPFWFGRKKCIGFQFARMEATLALAVLLRRYEFQLVQKDIGLVAGIVLHPKSVRAVVRRRPGSQRWPH